MKSVAFDENDLKQLTVVLNLLLQAKFEIKGDALGMAATGISWTARFLDRVKAAPVQSVPEVVEKKVKK